MKIITAFNLSEILACLFKLEAIFRKIELDFCSLHAKANNVVA